MAFELPERLSRDLAKDSRGERKAWVSNLPSVVEDLRKRWSLDIARPFQPGGAAGWVAPAVHDGLGAVVLKVGWRHVEAANEADALILWEGSGAVRLYAAEHVNETTSALLLERCDPGDQLGRRLPEHEQDEVIAGLLRRMWKVPPPNVFRSLTEMCDDWADEYEQQAPPPGSDPGLLRTGIELFRALPRSTSSEVLLCTDLHAGNALSSSREPWLVIDPKPHVGDPTYDALQHIYVCRARLAAAPDELIRRVATLLDLDAERLRLWVFARCIQESPGHPALYEIAARIAP